MPKLRLLVVLPGVVLLCVAAGYLLLEMIFAIFSIPISAVVIFLGIITPSSEGVVINRDRPDRPRIIVDKGILGTSVYQLVFFDSHLILKRLATSRTTILSFVLFALVGFFVEFVLGALAGVALAYALQEYIIQRNRDTVTKKSEFDTLRVGDLEFQSKDIEHINVYRNRLSLEMERGVVRIGLPRKYGDAMKPALTKIFSGKFGLEESTHSPDASREQD